MGVGTCRRSVLLPSLLLSALVLICLVPRPAASQVLYGSVLGDVKDSTGASVPGANVVITNKSTGLTREAVTDTAGHFNLPDLPAGVYSLKASQQGFKTFEQTEVTVNINSVTRVDVTLEVGAMGETVTVNAEPPKLQTDTAEVHSEPGRGGPAEPARCRWAGTTSRCTGCCPALRRLPTRTRSRPTRRDRWSSRSTGRATTRTTRASTASAPRNVQLPHVVLLRADARVDRGSQHRHQQHGRRAGARRRRRDQRADARAARNALHGSGFEYFTNQHLKAWPMRFDDAALNTGDKPEASYNQYGGTVGGPIKQNKAFFFVSYESTRDHRVVDNTVTVPTAGDAARRPVRCRPRRSTIRSPGTRTAPGARSSRCSRATRTTRCATPRRTRTASTSFPRRGWTPSRSRSRATFPPTTSTGEPNNYFVPGPVRSSTAIRWTRRSTTT